MGGVEIFEFHDSETVHFITYDSRKSELEIGFVNGSRYRYSDVPESVFGNFKNADSAGKFVHANIRNKFDFFRVL